MGDVDHFENLIGLDRKCPLCGSSRTRFREIYSDGDEIIESSFSRQQCRNCGLPCKFWDRIEKLVATCQAMADLRIAYCDENGVSEQDFGTLLQAVSEQAHKAIISSDLK